MFLLHFGCRFDDSRNSRVHEGYHAIELHCDFSVQSSAVSTSSRQLPFRGLFFQNQDLVMYRGSTGVVFIT